MRQPQLHQDILHTLTCLWPGHWVSASWPMRVELFSALQFVGSIVSGGRKKGSSLTEDRLGKCDWSWGEGSQWVCQVTSEQQTKIRCPSALYFSLTSRPVLFFLLVIGVSFLAMTSMWPPQTLNEVTVFRPWIFSCNVLFIFRAYLMFQQIQNLLKRFT